MRCLTRSSSLSTRPATCVSRKPTLQPQAAAGRTVEDAGVPNGEPQSVIIAGQPALLFETVANENTVGPLDAARDRQVIFVTDETLYRLEFIAPFSDADNAPATSVDALFESIMASFTLME